MISSSEAFVIFLGTILSSFESFFSGTISEGGGILAYYIDLPFIAGDGETKEEALKDLKGAFHAYVVSSLKDGDRVVEPKQATASKRINITLPNNLLEQIDKYTKKHHMSRSAFYNKLVGKYSLCDKI